MQILPNQSHLELLAINVPRFVDNTNSRERLLKYIAKMPLICP